MRFFGLRETIDPSRESIGNCTGISHHIWQSFDVIFLPNMQFECCMVLQGTLGGDFDIFAASGESIAWVLLWKIRSRPIGVRVFPVAQFNFFSTSFVREHGQWLCLERKIRDVSPSLLHLRTKEEMRQIISANLHFL